MARLVDRRSAAAPRTEVAELTEEGGPDVPAGLSPAQLLSQTWRLVQNLADTLPDDVTRFARQSLVLNEPEQALSALLFACIHFGTALTTVEYAVLTECLLSIREDVGLLDHLRVDDVERAVVFEFVNLPQLVSDVAGSPAPEGPDDEGSPQRRTALAEEIDQKVATRFGTKAAALGVWRAWRYPLTGAAWPRPTPVYLVEARDEESAMQLAMAFYGNQDLWPEPGEPILEVYPTGVELPPLHRAVQFAGDLVFAASPPPAFTFADVFDGEPDPDGRPQDVVRIDEDDADRLLRYLMSGTPMLVADAQGEDVLDPSRGQTVPLHLRTDGAWVWSDATAYYVREHLVAPPAAFHAYLRTVPDTADRVDDVTLHQAVAWLQAS